MADRRITTSNVKCKSALLELLPFVGGNTGTAVYPNVYLPRAIYRNIHSSNPDPYNVCLVIHEQEHIKRIEQAGVLCWYARYLFDRRFRFEEELAATKPQFAFIKSRGLTFDLERKARLLSGPLYLWSVSQGEARRRVQEAWDKA